MAVAVPVGRVLYPGMTEHIPNIDPDKFEVCGSDMQVLNASLNAGEKMQSVPGALNYMDPNIKMSVSCNKCFGRCMSCTSIVLTDYTNHGPSGAIVGLTPNFPAKVIPLVIEKGIVYRAHRHAYFAAIGDIEVGYDIDCCSKTCLFAGRMLHRPSNPRPACLPGTHLVLDPSRGQRGACARRSSATAPRSSPRWARS